MKHLIEVLLLLLVAPPWLAGIVFAAGVWETMAAVLVPFYAWYLCMERLLLALGWL